MRSPTRVRFSICRMALTINAEWLTARTSTGKGVERAQRNNRTDRRFHIVRNDATGPALPIGSMCRASLKFTNQTNRYGKERCIAILTGALSGRTISPWKCPPGRQRHEWHVQGIRRTHQLWISDGKGIDRHFVQRENQNESNEALHRQQVGYEI